MPQRAKPSGYLKLNIVTHPLAQHKLAYLRDRACSVGRFRQLTRELGSLLAFEALRDRPLNMAKIRTPFFEDEEFEAFPMADKVVVVAILRAGLALADGALDVVPNAHVGHISLRRRADEYAMLEPDLVALPDLTGRFVIVMDTVIGTGATACAALELLAAAGAPQTMLSLASIVAARPGLAEIERKFPAISVCTVAVDPRVDERNHVKPGLGDTALRIYGE